MLEYRIYLIIGNSQDRGELRTNLSAAYIETMSHNRWDVVENSQPYLHLRARTLDVVCPLDTTAVPLPDRLCKLVSKHRNNA